MKVYFSIILFFLSTFNFGQSLTITGKVSDFIISESMPGAYIYFDKNNSAISDFEGKFSITVDKKILNDTLKIKYISYRTLFITKLPTTKDTLDLGIIPMFDSNSLLPIYDIFCNCKWYQLKCRLKCRHKTRSGWKIVEMKEKEYFEKTNKSIESFRFKFDNKIYKLTYTANKENLCVFLDLSKPE